jgi:hypothetical protein
MPMVTELKDMMQSGAFKPVIDRVYSLDRIVDAYSYVETGRKLGNVVIRLISRARASAIRSCDDVGVPWPSRPKRSERATAVPGTLPGRRHCGLSRT